MKFVECPECDDTDAERCERDGNRECSCLCHRVVTLEQQVDFLKGFVTTLRERLDAVDGVEG